MAATVNRPMVKTFYEYRGHNGERELRGSKYEGQFTTHRQALKAAKNAVQAEGGTAGDAFGRAVVERRFKSGKIAYSPVMLNEPIMARATFQNGNKRVVLPESYTRLNDRVLSVVNSQVEAIHFQRPPMTLGGKAAVAGAGLAAVGGAALAVDKWLL
jgi:hypothetical protein